MNKYDKVLKRFVGGYDDPQWTKKPHRYGKYIIATDTHILIRIDATKCEGEYSPSEKPQIMERVFPEPNCNLELDILGIAQTINGIPEEVSMPVSGEDAKCPECQGRGTVTWEYESHDGIKYNDFDCPECDGRGYIKNKTFSRYERNIEIGGAKFMVAYLTEVLEAMYQLGHKKTRVVSHSETKPMMFTPESGVDIIIMPNQYKDIAASYSLKSINNENNNN